MNRAFWAPQVEALAPANRVVSLDLPGHGRLAAEPFTLAGAVVVVRAAVESERGPLGMPSTTPTVLVGLSLGGYVAMAAAAESPSIADALVLAGATAEPTGRRAGPFRVLALAFDRADSALVGRLAGAFLRRRYPNGLGELLVTSGFDYRGGASALRSIAGESFLPRLAAFPGPAFLVNGRGDLAMRPGERRFLAAAQHGRLVHLAGAFHLSSLDRPAQFNAVIRSAVSEAAALVDARGATGSGTGSTT